MLIFFRVLQGMGGGGLAPSEQAILADTFPPKQRGMAFAVYGIAVVVAPAIGPTLGGWITDNFSWRWIFFINVPVGLLSLFLTTCSSRTRRTMQQQRKEMLKRGLQRRLRRLRAGRRRPGLPGGGARQGAGGRLVRLPLHHGLHDRLRRVDRPAASFWELYTDDPVVDLPLLKDRTFLVSNVIMFMLGFILFGSTVLIPQFLQG